MNVNNPHLRSIDPPDGPDYLASGVLQALARPFGAYKSWSFLRTTIRAVLTFGLGPIITLPRRFREFVTMEQEQYWHLAEWLRLNSPHPDAARLCEDAETLRPRYEFQMLAWLATAFVAVLFFTQLGRGHGFNSSWFSQLLECTWLFQHEPIRYLPPLLARKLYVVWSVGLGVGYLCYWQQIRSHEAAVSAFLARLNRITTTDGFPPVKLMTLNARIGKPVWVLGAVAFGLVGAWWGIAMMIAAAAHRAYVIRISVHTRAALAHQLRAMLLRRHPSMKVPLPIYLRHRCKNDLCRCQVPSHALYCPRCGRKLSPPLSVIA